jgi:hypothetical protein
MKTRIDFARFFLFIATIYWAIWLGGYIFNTLMLVPLWSYNPPDSVVNHFSNQQYLIYFFAVVNPWAFVVSTIAWIVSIKVDTGARVWLGRATLLAWIMFPLKVYMIITIGGIVKSALDGNFNPDMVNAINLWKSLDWVTIVISTTVLTLHLVAILNFNNPRKIKK